MRGADSPLSTYQALSRPPHKASTIGERSLGITGTLSLFVHVVSFAMPGGLSPLSTYQALSRPPHKASTIGERSLGITGTLSLFVHVVSFAMRGGLSPLSTYRVVSCAPFHGASTTRARSPGFTKLCRVRMGSFAM